MIIQSDAHELGPIPPIIDVTGAWPVVTPVIVNEDDLLLAGSGMKDKKKITEIYL